MSAVIAFFLALGLVIAFGTILVGLVLFLRGLRGHLHAWREGR